MKVKREDCKYCGQKIEAKTTRQEFCSSKCRVYWNRQQKNPMDTFRWIDGNLNEIAKPKEPPKGTSVSVTLNKWNIDPNRMTLDKIKDSCPSELTGLARSVWIAEERKKYNI